MLIFVHVGIALNMNHHGLVVSKLDSIDFFQVGQLNTRPGPRGISLVFGFHPLKVKSANSLHSFSSK